MTNARPEKKKRGLFGHPDYNDMEAAQEADYAIQMYNQSHAECMAYTDALLRPLEEALKRDREIGDMEQGYHILNIAIQSVLQRHKGTGTGEGEQ